MAKEAMDNALFEQLLSRINQETGKTETKLEILYSSRGFFSALQASRILYAFGIPSDKVRAIQIMEPKLCRMTCSEARDIIGAMSIHNDKIKALECIKRVLCDCQTREGVESILGAFPFEPDKQRALQILCTVGSYVGSAVPAGGHQGYAALGALYTQCRPLVPHLYGTIEEQKTGLPGQGKIILPVHAQSGVLPSMYSGHPSYAYPQGRDYATERGYPGNDANNLGESQFYMGDTGECPAKPELCDYPPQGSYQSFHLGGPAPTGFQGLASGYY